MISSRLNALFNSLHLNSQEKDCLFKTSRLVIYFFVLIFLVLGLWWLSKQFGSFTFAETGPVESVQLSVLLITSFIFLKDALLNKTYRPLLLFLASLTFFAFIREQDNFFEILIPIISWKFAWLFPMATLGYMFKKRTTFKKILFSFLNSRAFQIMFTAIIVFIPLAQCIGHRAFIVDATGSAANMFYIRRFIEETMELMAYILIFFSSIELRLELIKEDKHPIKT